MHPILLTQQHKVRLQILNLTEPQKSISSKKWVNWEDFPLTGQGCPVEFSAMLHESRTETLE